ncbi:MAG TPA: hypothetical protein VN626_11520 [Clostridia bacterium]|nr:hypothetical protein [Clostridia bacterium]
MNVSVLSGSDAPRICYCVTLATHGRRRLLAESVLIFGKQELILTSTGNAVSTVWQTMPHSFTDIAINALYLMPDSICSIVTVICSGDNADTANLRLLHRMISGFKAETTHLYNRMSAQDYNSRLWQTAFECKVLAPDALDAQEKQLAAQGALQVL